MSKYKKQNGKGNLGFTLIEMIVTVAIVAIFSGVVLSLITSSSSSYRNTSSSAKVQMETQETFDKIEDMIINANRNLYYFTADKKAISNDIKGKGADNSSGGKIFMVSSGDDSDTASQMDDDDDIAVMSASNTGTGNIAIGSGNTGDTTTVLKNENDRQCIVWEKSTGKIKYVHYVKKGNGWKRISQDDEILATGILDFRADISKALSDKIVRFQLTTQNGTKKIDTLHSVSLRNELGISEQIDIDPDIDPVEPTPTVTETPAPTPTKEPTPVSLSLNTESILVAAGYNGLKLNDVIECTVNYDDGKNPKTLTASDLEWESDCGFANVNSNGELSVESSAGTDTTGCFDVTVKAPGYQNISAKLTIIVARIDIVKPTGEYRVGDSKEWECIYKENGQAVTTVTPTTNVTKGSQKVENYIQSAQAQGKFEETDVGNWEITSEVNLTSRNGVGIVQTATNFSVGESIGIGQIHTRNKDAAYVVEPGREYECGVDPGLDFIFALDGANFGGATETIEWGIKGGHITSKRRGENSPYLSSHFYFTVESDSNGFVIWARYTRHTDWGLGTPIEMEVYAEREVSVIKDAKIVSTLSTLKVGAQYVAAMDITIRDTQGEKVIHNVTNESNDTIIHWQGMFKLDCFENDIDEYTKTFTVKSSPPANVKEIVAKLEKWKYLVQGNFKNLLTDTMEVSVKK